MKRLLLLIFLLSAPFSGCIQDENPERGFKGSETNVSVSATKPPTVEELAKEIGKNPDEFLYPYDGFNYDSVTVSVEGDKITVVAKVKGVPGEDVYLLVYENGSLLLKSYLLEALPLSLKERAISVAMSNETIHENANGYVTVRRVLPHTAAKFYMPKELFSVTWHGDRIVSALVDLEEGRVVRVYVSE